MAPVPPQRVGHRLPRRGWASPSQRCIVCSSRAVLVPMLNQPHAPNVDPLSSRTFAVTTFDAPQLVVLLVEDNPGDARLIRIMLAESGYAPMRLVHVDRLAAALERVRQSDITVVLIDLGLPDSQGLETFVQLRDAVPHLPIVVLSGDTDTGLALRAVREGAQGVVASCLLPVAC